MRASSLRAGVAVVDDDSAGPVRDRGRAAREANGDLWTLRLRPDVVEVEERDVLIGLDHHEATWSSGQEQLRGERDALRQATEAPQRARRHGGVDRSREVDDDNLVRVLDERGLRRAACRHGAAKIAAQRPSGSIASPECGASSG